MKVVLQNLTKIFPSRNKKDKNAEVIAVNDFNLEIPDPPLLTLLDIYTIKRTSRRMGPKYQKSFMKSELFS